MGSSADFEGFEMYYVAQSTSIGRPRPVDKVKEIMESTSNNEYKHRLQILKYEIDLALATGDKDLFLKLSKEFRQMSVEL